MNYIKEFYRDQDKIVFYSTSFVLLAIFLMILPFFIFSIKLPHELPLFYSLPWGNSQLGEKQLYLVLPLLCGSILFINLFVAWHLHESQTFLKRILTVSTAIISIAFLIASVRIISIFI